MINEESSILYDKCRNIAYIERKESKLNIECTHVEDAYINELFEIKVTIKK